MEKREKGYFQQVAITKGGDGQTACGSFPGIYTRLDDPDVFDWMESVIFDPCNSNPCGSNADCDVAGIEFNDGSRAVCTCRKGYVRDPYNYPYCETLEFIERRNWYTANGKLG